MKTTNLGERTTSYLYEARIAELEKALEPFAKAMQYHVGSTLGDDVLIAGLRATDYITLGDLRRARKITRSPITK